MTVVDELKQVQSKNTRWGLDNPHPLSRMRTELIWEGKYDEYGNRREVDIAGCSMPMQKIETVDEPADRLKQLGLFDARQAYPDDFRNRLIWGDNKLVMASLLEEFRGQIKLIYIDPPFDVGADFTLSIELGNNSEVIEKDQSILEMVAYKDMWGKQTDSYLHMLAERLPIMRELLSDDGSIYIHLGPQVSHYVKLLLDDIFGKENFQNQIIREKCNPKNYTSSNFGNIHDVIFFYSKNQNKTWNKVFTVRDEEQIKKDFPLIDSKTGKRYKTAPLHATGKRNGETGKPWRGITLPDTHHWRYIHSTLDDMDAKGEIEWSSTGNPRRKVFAESSEGYSVQDIWLSYKDVAQDEYPTQKPDLLLERIIQASSNKGDLIADFFCGSGTTLAVAEELGRRWIGADLGRFAIHTSRKRMIEIQRKRHKNNEPYRPFDIYNLGRYERQWWQQERLQGADDEHRKVVLGFYKAEVLTNSPSPLLHGKKGRAFVYVDSIDSLLTREELESVAEACHVAGGKELHCLAWEFEMDLKQEALRLEKECNLQSIRFIPIPREIMEKNRKEAPPFLEMAELEAEPVIQKEDGKKVVEIKLTRFRPSLAEVPSKELMALQERAVQSGFDFIDFWAVDFDYNPDLPFYHHWQAYRMRKNRKLPTVSDRRFSYDKPGKYTVCVKVIDVFGCDTTTLVEVTV